MLVVLITRTESLAGARWMHCLTMQSNIQGVHQCAEMSLATTQIDLRSISQTH